ncbi:MAG: hypothetical protein JO108_03945 [Acidobacteriaceae bacterium]|nr:hypothetical protein [Acidobacteriaceae bacterium]
MTNSLISRIHATKLIALGIAAMSIVPAGCVSSERRLAADKDQCADRSLTPSTNAYDECVADATSRRHEVEARQSVRMQQVQDQSMENFMHSQSTAP